MFDNKSQREVQKPKQNSHIFYDFCVNISSPPVGGGGGAEGRRTGQAGQTGLFFPYISNCAAITVNNNHQVGPGRATRTSAETMWDFHKFIRYKTVIKQSQLQLPTKYDIVVLKVYIHIAISIHFR